MPPVSGRGAEARSVPRAFPRLSGLWARAVSQAWKPRFGKPDLLIALVLALMLGGTWAISGRIISQTERASTESAFVETRNLSRLMALQRSAMLQQIDSLQRIARFVMRAHLAGAPDEGELLNELRQASALPGSHMAQVSAISPSGDVLWSTLPVPPGGVNISRREHILAIVRDGKDRFIGRPVLGAVSGKWTLQFSEAMRNPDGTLRAITVVSVEARVIEALAQELAIGNQGVLSLIRSDGLVLARSPNSRVGETIPAAGRLWSAALRTGAAEMLTPGPLDGVPRFYAARRIAGGDLVVVIGLDEAGQSVPVPEAAKQIRRWTAALSAALLALAVAASLGIRRQRSLTQERQRVRLLAERDTLLRQMTESLTDLICLHDSKGRYLEMGRAASALLGEQREHFIGALPGRTVLPEDRQLFRAAWKRLVSSATPQRLEFRIRRADGAIRWLESELTTVAPAAGSAEPRDRFLSVTRDVTERRLADRRLSMLVAAMPGILMQAVVDADGTEHCLYMSDAILEILGYSPECALTPGFFARLLTPDAAAQRRAVIAQQPDGGRFELSYLVCHQDGGVVWMQETATVRDRPGGQRMLVSVLMNITAQHNARAELAQARADLDAIVADGPGVLFRMDVLADGGVQPGFVSSNVERVLGYSRDEMLRPGFFQSISEMSAALAKAPIGGRAAGESLSLAFRYRNPAGGWNWLRSTIHPVGAGSPGGELLGVMVDVTEERAAAAALAEAQRHLEVFAEAGPCVLYRRMFDESERNRVIYVSPNVERVLGLSVEDVMATAEMESRLDPATVAPMQDRLARLAETGESAYTVRYRDRAGQWRWMAVAAKVITNHEGKPELLGMGFDVTRLRMAEEERDQAKADLATMAAAGPGALYRLSVDAAGSRRIVSMGENFIKLTGLPVAPLLGDGFPADRFDSAPWPSLQTLEQGDFSCQYRFRHAEGHWVWLQDSATVVARHPDGGYDTIGYLTDITREKEMAAQVAQAGKMAMLGEMATGMAHELNQPLTAMSMAAENGLALLPEDSPRAEQVRRKFVRITEQAMRAGAIIEHLRIFARREPGPKGRLSLIDAVDGARLILESRLRLDGIALDIDLPSGLPPVLAKSLPVEQVLVNLLLNACDAYKDADSAAERRIRISAVAEDGIVRLLVADAAGGISDPSRVFEPFYTTKEVGQGTGLGLSISYGLIAELGGRLSVGNEGGGAVFKIELPVAAEAIA